MSQHNVRVNLWVNSVWDDGSYDSEFDSQTGWVEAAVPLAEHGLNWGKMATGRVRRTSRTKTLWRTYRPGQVGEVDILWQNGFTYQTMYNDGTQWIVEHIGIPAPGLHICGSAPPTRKMRETK